MVSAYSVFGLTLQCSSPLPHLDAQETTEGEILEVELGSVPRGLLAPAEKWRTIFESGQLDDRGEPLLRFSRHREDDVFRFSYCDGTEFFIERAGARIWARWTPPSTLEDAATYLLGPVLGFVLRLRGMIALHASAVVIDDRAVAFAGPQGAGKSTLAAAFAQLGYPVLTDDVTALKPSAGELLAQTDCSLVRLWPESSEMLCGSVEALPRLAESWEKRFLDLAGHGYAKARRPRPLAAVYLLDGDPVAEEPPRIESVGGRDGLMALIANSYANLLLDAEMLASELDLFAVLLERLSIRRVHQPMRRMRPEELCDSLAADFRRLPRP